MGEMPDIYPVFLAADRLHMSVPDVLKLPRWWVHMAIAIRGAEIEAENEMVRRRTS